MRFRYSFCNTKRTRSIFIQFFLYRNATFLSGFSRIIVFPISGADLGDLVITRETCLIWFFLYQTHTFHFYTVLLYRNATFPSGFSRIIVFPISGVDLGDPVQTRHAINLHSLETRQTLSVGRPTSNPPDITHRAPQYIHW